MDTITLVTARVLRDNPDLRSVENRELVLDKVRDYIPEAKFSTVERSIRKIQNKWGMWTPTQQPSLPMETKKQEEKYPSLKHAYVCNICMYDM